MNPAACLILPVALAACGSGARPVSAPPAKPAETVAPAPAPPSPVTRDLSRADTWLCQLEEWEACQERCDQGNALSCARLAQLYQFGWSRYGYDLETFEPDPAAAVVAQERACELGYAPACARLGASLLDDDGATDEARGRALLREACDGGTAWGCAWLAGLDGEDREAMLGRACALGDRDACVDAAVIAGDEHGDDDAATRGMTRALQGAPSPSPLAAAVVTCTGDTFAVAEESSLVLMGPPRMETYCATADGKREGPHLIWFSEEDLWEGREHGVILHEGSFHADLREGAVTTRDDEGRLTAEGEYIAGVRDGRWVEWDMTAMPERRDEGTYRADQRQGTWTTYSGDQITRIITYVDDVEEGIRIALDADGGRCEIAYVNGRTHGLYRCWDAAGTLLSESTWVDGHLEGLDRRWYANGKLEHRGAYRDHRRTGKWTFYTDSGKKAREGTYEDGEEVGTWKAWDDAGRVVDP